MARLRIYLFGSFHVTLDGESLTGFESNKVRALLAYLAVEATDRPHRRDALIGLLWPDCDDHAARRNLSQALFNLRQVLHDDGQSPSFLEVTRETLRFNPDSDAWLDVAEFSGKMQGAGSKKQDAGGKIQDSCLLPLASCVELYRGEFLAGFFVDDSVPFAEWASLLRERFHRQVLDALYRLTEYYEQQQDTVQARRCARRQVELDPWREEAHLQLMRLLVRDGQRSAALAQYETCRKALAAELGIEPGEAIRRLYRRIRSVSEIGAHNLPPQMTPFVGRGLELRRLARHLADPTCRLLSLVGPGGIGKTRLAIQAAYENRTLFLHGVCFVPLATVSSPAFLVAVLADALALHPQNRADLKGCLLDALRERELLLVLDNFEPLVAAGELLAEILHTAPDVRLLVTSRERLNLYGEGVFDVAGLATPREAEVADVAEYGAVALFLQCADRARAGFAPGPDEWTDIARICGLVEGMPLGIELAAAWVRMFSCREIADRIAQSLDFLSTTMGGVPARHRSVQAAFDYSWERLPADEQRVFAALSVFRGEFDGAAAAQVAGASPLLLAHLCDRSFLRQTPSGRYTPHELLRQYAAEKLAAVPQVAHAARAAHCEYYARFVPTQLERFRAGDQRAALDAIEMELDNVHAAWEWAVAQAHYAGIEGMMDGFYTFYFERALPGGDALFEMAARTLEAAVAGPSQVDAGLTRLWAGLLWRWSEFHYRERSAYTESAALAEHGVALLRTLAEPRELSRALCTLGTVLRDLGRYAESRQCLAESVALSRQLGDQGGAVHRHLLARSLTALSGIMGVMGDYAAARDLLQENLALCRESGNLIGMADTLNTLGGIAYRAGEYGEAKRCYLESRAAYDALGEAGWANVARSNLGHACHALGEYTEAGQYLRDALQASLVLSQGRFTLNILHGLAELWEKQGRLLQAYELAAFVVHSALAYRENVKLARQTAEALAAKLSPEEVAVAEVRVSMWTLDDAVAEALL